MKILEISGVLAASKSTGKDAAGTAAKGGGAVKPDPKDKSVAESDNTDKSRAAAPVSKSAPLVKGRTAVATGSAAARKPASAR